MNKVTKPPPEMRFKLIVGSFLMAVGCLVMAFLDRIWFLGIIIEGIGAVLVFPTLKRWQRIMPSFTMNQRKKKFAALVAVFTFWGFACPFVLHWYDPKQSFKVLVVISVIFWPLSIAYSYWYMFKKLK